MDPFHAKSYIAARALATYLIPGSLGEGSGWDLRVPGNLEIWEFGDLEIWRSGNLEIQKFGDLGIWKSRIVGSKT